MGSPIKRILFYLLKPPCPENGGVQRVTYQLAKRFSDEGYLCYCLFVHNDPFQIGINPFKELLCVDFHKNNASENIIHFVMKNKIDIIINQCSYTPKILNLLNKVKKNTGIILITCMHNTPSVYNYNVLNKENYLKSLIYNRLIYLKTVLHYKKILKSSDKFVVLSTSFIQELCRFGIKVTNKIIAIPNPLTFEEFVSKEDVKKKEKNVLIVARFNEAQKRILLALKIWKMIEPFGYNDWRLVIVGYGEAEARYRQTVLINQIKNIEFVGKKDPKPYYKKASIFMMTSAFEGWGLTLTESQQMGVVPIVFDSYSSVYDIIKNNHNGIIIRNNDIESYCENLIKLMSDDFYRHKIAYNALSDSQKYEIKYVVEEWVRLFDSLK